MYLRSPSSAVHTVYTAQVRHYSSCAHTLLQAHQLRAYKGANMPQATPSYTQSMGRAPELSHTHCVHHVDVFAERRGQLQSQMLQLSRLPEFQLKQTMHAQCPGVPCYVVHMCRTWPVLLDWSVYYVYATLEYLARGPWYYCAWFLVFHVAGLYAETNSHRLGNPQYVYLLGSSSQECGSSECVNVNWIFQVRMLEDMRMGCT